MHRWSGAATEQPWAGCALYIRPVTHDNENVGNCDGSRVTLRLHSPLHPLITITVCLTPRNHATTYALPNVAHLPWECQLPPRNNHHAQMSTLKQNWVRIQTEITVQSINQSTNQSINHCDINACSNTEGSQISLAHIPRKKNQQMDTKRKPMNIKNPENVHERQSCAYTNSLIYWTNDFWNK